MNIVWILFGITTLSETLPFCEAQISQISSNQNDLSGGTYVESAWSADSLAGASNKPVSTWQRVQQRVVNPNMFGSFQQNLPSKDRRGQRSRSLSPTVFPETRTASQGMGPFDPNIQVEAAMYQTEPAPPTTAVYDRLLVGVTRDRQNRVTARYKLDKKSGLVQPRPTVSKFHKNQPSRYRILPDGSIVDYGISFSDVNPRNIPFTRDVRPTVAQPAPPLSTQITRIDTKTVKSRRFSTKPTTTFRSRPSAAPKISPVKPAVKSIESIQPSKIWTRPTGESGVAVPVIQRRPQTSTVSRARKRPADDGVRRTGGGVVDDPRWQFEPKSDTRSRFYTPSRTQSMSMTTTTTTTTTTPVPTTTKTTTTTKKPKRTPWDGPGAVNITHSDDNHVCPPSRARWQDYTVFLETKPRLCMIQITWNARYEREPIYHNSWWGGVDVEWIYKTVYDPEVKFVDLHGWNG